MKLIHGYIKIIDKFNLKLGEYTSWLTLLLVLIVCYDVFMRYLVKESSAALQELEWHIFSLIFLLAAGYTLKIDDHVRVDIIYVKLSKKKRALIDFLGSVFFLIPFCIIAIISSQGFVYQSFITQETSSDAGGLPARWILKSFIPISFFILMLEGISFAFKSYLEIRNKESQTAGENP
jgi:TRAP-type mannitol/chloroaromatic compound transport system permease small subunit